MNPDALSTVPAPVPSTPLGTLLRPLYTSPALGEASLGCPCNERCEGLLFREASH